ncbi:interleukin-27 subunit beta [Trichomycterus rosablanca]|uniref:interleukin-27 subunit beta n=1 Tax=Trichomycterus rosablanca TaxID=2290929 RepID=UPI002F35598C
MCLRFVHVVPLLAVFHQVWSQNTSPLPKPSSVKEISVAVGSSVELHCANETTAGSDWRLNELSVGTGDVLHLHNTSLDDQGVYTCHDQDGDTVETIHLRLGYAPSPPEVRCWSPSYPVKALCSWTLTPDPVLQTQYISTYWYQGVVHPCPRQDEQVRRCVLEGLDIYSNEPYLVNITAVNALGSASRIISVIFEDIVKPNPPVNVKVKVLPGKKISVQWSPPPTWPDPVNFPLRYNVQFQWGKPEMTSVMRSIESDSVVRSGIVAGRTYFIRVSCMDFLGHGQSSDWSDLVNVTLPKS